MTVEIAALDTDGNILEKTAAVHDARLFVGLDDKMTAVPLVYDMF